MNTHRFISLLAVVIACSGLSCQKRIKTSAVIVRLNSKPTFGVSSGGQLKWVGEGKDGWKFQITFKTPLACKEGIPKGGPQKAAICTVPPKT